MVGTACTLLLTSTITVAAEVTVKVRRLIVIVYPLKQRIDIANLFL